MSDQQPNQKLSGTERLKQLATQKPWQTLTAVALSLSLTGGAVYANRDKIFPVATPLESEIALQGQELSEKVQKLPANTVLNQEREGLNNQEREELSELLKRLVAQQNNTSVRTCLKTKFNLNDIAT